MNRRRFLKMAGMASAVSFFPHFAHAYAEVPYKKALSFYNTHTGEKLHRTFWAEGVFIPDALADINHILRDHRNGVATQMDTRIFHLLHAIHTNLGSQEPFHIISGYRSPQSNAKLVTHSSGVAKKSLHMEGKAIDIYLPGRNLVDLKKIAMSLQQGGVGYYPDSNFVHVDIGKVRYW